MTENPISEHLVRTLRYLDLVGPHGVTESELDNFAQEAEPRPVEWNDLATSSLSRLARQWRTPVQGDSVSFYMQQVGWVSRRGQHLVLSSLGEALAARLGRDSEPEEVSDEGVVVMSPEDPMRYELLTRKLADADMLVDPFFKAGQLDWLVNMTTISRVLLKPGTKPTKTRSTISMTLGAFQEQGKPLPEVRMTDSPAIHDRAILHRDGRVGHLGTSLTGIAKHLTVYTPLPAEQSASYAAHVESWWDSAEAIQPRADFEAVIAEVTSEEESPATS